MVASDQRALFEAHKLESELLSFQVQLWFLVEVAHFLFYTNFQFSIPVFKKKKPLPTQI